MNWTRLQPGSARRALAALAACVAAAALPAAQSRVLFTDDFEAGLDRWQITGGAYVQVRPAGGDAHGRVMVLEPGGDVLALIKGSEQWGAIRLEGDVLFPTPEDNYLGVAYNYRRRGSRDDFGLIYIKGNDSYLQVNPHRDFNVSRTLYPEGRVNLAGAAAIVTGTWQRFAVEVVGANAHFYVGDLTTPQLTFGLFEHTQGAVGLQPRSVGGPVWVDNVRVTAIDRLSYDGPARPNIAYAADALLTDWQVAGPFAQTRDEAARNPADASIAWSPFPTDARGAVVTGRVVDYHGPNAVAYFRTTVNVGIGGPATLELSTVDDLAIWINGRFHWFVPRAGAAWHDIGRNPARASQRIPIALVSGGNDIVVRVRGGVYASGGFFARVITDP